MKAWIETLGRQILIFSRRFLGVGVGLLVLAFGCHENEEAREVSEREHVAAPARFLALGDSYTIGEGVPARERWPVLLAARLRIGEPEIVARTGWTTVELQEGIARARPRGPYGLVTLLIGVNDQFRGKSPKSYRPRFAALLERAIAFAGGEAVRVVVLSIPDWGVTPFAEGDERDVSAEIDAFNAINRQATLAAGAAYVDVTPSSKRAAQDRSLLAPDGLHPSGKLYREWVELVLPAANVALGR